MGHRLPPDTKTLNCVNKEIGVFPTKSIFRDWASVKKVTFREIWSLRKFSAKFRTPK